MLFYRKVLFQIVFFYQTNGLMQQNYKFVLNKINNILFKAILFL